MLIQQDYYGKVKMIEKSDMVESNFEHSCEIQKLLNYMWGRNIFSRDHNGDIGCKRLYLIGFRYLRKDGFIKKTHQAKEGQTLFLNNIQVSLTTIAEKGGCDFNLIHLLNL